MKKKILLVPLLIVMLLFTGCWDYTEYDQMTQIYSVGIDLDEKTNKLVMTLQFIPTTKSSTEKPGGGDNKGTVYSASDFTIMDAATKLQQASPNRLFFGYMQVLVIGENAAKYAMKDIIEYFGRTPGIRNSVNVIVVPGRAEGVIATRDPNSPTSSGKKMRSLLSSYQSNGTVYSVTLHDFLKMTSREGCEEVAPKIITTSHTNGRGSSSGGQNDVRFAIENPGNLMANGMAAFKNGKFVGWLDDKETMGLNWILGNKITAYKTSNIVDPKLKNDTDKSLSYKDANKMLHFYITRSGSKVKVKLENGKPVVYVNIKVEAALRKYYSDKGDEYINPDIVDLIEGKLEKSVYSDAEAAVKRGKDELDSDIFGFGFDLYRQHPKKWHKYYEKTWRNMFRSVPVKINVEAKLNNTGTNMRKFYIK